MIDFVNHLKERIQKEIDRIEQSGENSIKKSLEASHILGDAFDRLKEYIISYEFRSQAEEIEFFKELKPRLFCKLIYYRKIYNIEMNRPVADCQVQKEYLRSELDAINRYIAKRLDFIRYYRSGATYLDSLYFLRGQTDTEQYLESFYYELDPHFSTNCDFKVARILAGDMLQTYLVSEMEKLEYEPRRCGVEPFPESRLTWQGSKTDLIELIYALDSAGAFGNVPLTQVASYFETSPVRSRI
jgi:RteC protein.